MKRRISFLMVTVLLCLLLLPVCANAAGTSYQVTTSLKKLSSSNTADHYEANGLDDYFTTLIPDAGYTFPVSVLIKVDGNKLYDGSDYQYDDFTGKLQIKASSLTGDLHITASAMYELPITGVSWPVFGETADTSCNFPEDSLYQLVRTAWVDAGNMFSLDLDELLNMTPRIDWSDRTDDDIVFEPGHNYYFLAAFTAKTGGLIDPDVVNPSFNGVYDEVNQEVDSKNTLYIWRDLSNSEIACSRGKLDFGKKELGYTNPPNPQTVVYTCYFAEDFAYFPLPFLFNPDDWDAESNFVIVDKTFSGDEDRISEEDFSLVQGEEVSITIQPKKGLEVGVYRETLCVDFGDASVIPIELLFEVVEPEASVPSTLPVTGDKNDPMLYFAFVVIGGTGLVLVAKDKKRSKA